MKRALAWALVTSLGVGCGGAAGSTEPAKSVTDAVAPLPDAPLHAPAAGRPAADQPAGKPAASGDGADDGAWPGEAEAKSAKAPDGAGNTETRTMAVIAQVVKENRKPVRECFEQAKKDLPDLKGDMVIHFVVDPNGKVREADLNQQRSTLKSSAVVACAIKVIQGIKFPPSSRGMDTTVNYPFNLN